MSSYRSMRRQARRVRRTGMQPMMLFNTGDQFPETALVVLVRWAWRYRSELAPVFLAAVVLSAGWWLHTAHPHWWASVVTLTVAIVAVLAVAGHRLGIPTRAECLYAAAVAAGTGGWLAAATVAGPFAAPLPVVLVVAGMVLAVPWWAHGRRRARVRVERKLAVWPVISQAVGLEGSQVMSAVVDMWGWRARFRLARGQTIDDAHAKLPAIESALGTFRGAARVYPTPDDLANRFELRVLDKDPHAEAIPWPGPSVTSITQPIDLGPFEDATPALVSFLRRHGLFGGGTGWGKSGGLNLINGNLVACTDVAIWAIDLKRGMELAPWASCIDWLATTPDEARAMLTDGVAVLEARAADLAAAGRRIWEPSPQRPALIIIVDEFAELTEAAPEAKPDSDSIGRRGRAVAVQLIAATQRPTQKAMGQGALRSMMDIRICFRVRERRDVDLILGQGMLTAGWNAHKLNAPGKFLVSAPGHDTPKPARAYLLDDETVAATAARYADHRPALDPISAAACRARPGSSTATSTPAPSTGQDGASAPMTGWWDQARRGPDPEAVLWRALQEAPAEGISVGVLMTVTGMGRSWVYYRLAEHAAAGRAVQITRGCWRATPEPS
jgi:S-DNA-T family DNA segregation ATPase FtsK/SpoIIIE